MPGSIIVTLIVIAALGYALRAGRRDELIARTPYNNRYSDASGARDEQRQPNSTAAGPPGGVPAAAPLSAVARLRLREVTPRRGAGAAPPRARTCRSRRRVPRAGTRR